MNEAADEVGDLKLEVEALRRRIAELEALRVPTHLPEDEPRRIAERYRSVLEHVTNVIYSHTADHVLTYISPQTKALLGCEPEEALVRWTELVTDHPINEMGLALTQKALDTGEQQPPYELELKHAQGGRVWVEVHEAPVVRDGKTVAIVGALTDITKRKRMAQLLRIELKLSAALGAAQDLPEVLHQALDAARAVEEVDAGGVYLADEPSGELHLVYHGGLSVAFVERVRRIASDDPRVQRVRSVAGCHFAHLDDLCVAEGLRTTAIFPVRHDGHLIACLNVASRSVVEFPPSVLDALETIASQVGPVISRVRAELSLRQSESTLRGVFRAAPAGIGLVSDRTFRWVNEHMARMTGYTEEELVGKSSRLVYESDEEFERVGRVKYARIRETGTGAVETRWRCRDGGLIDVHLSSSVLDPSDFSAGTVFTAWDVTERKRAEAERHRLEAQVQHAQKLESLGVLAGGIAHDFNNILHVILGNVNLAVERLPAGSSAGPYVQEIGRAVARAAGLCDQMLAYSGRGSVDVRSLDLGDLVRDIAAMLEISVSKKATLRVSPVGELSYVEADPSQLRQVVMNLVTNASEALGESAGRIDLRIDDVALEAATIHEAFADYDLTPGAYVRLVVEDTGHGMTLDARRRIFEPFFTTKFQGRGLGMAAVLGIIRAHGGGIRVDSAEGEGTKVTVVLPAVAPPARSDEVPEVPVTVEHGAGTILFVDDEHAIRALGDAVLRAAGYEVLLAADGREAVEVYRSRREDIAAVVLDQTMPEMDGEETFRELRGMGSSVPVVLCSGYSEQELRTRFTGADGPTAFLQKPFRNDDLLRALAGALDR